MIFRERVWKRMQWPLLGLLLLTAAACAQSALPWPPSQWLQRPPQKTIERYSYALFDPARLNGQQRAYDQQNALIMGGLSKVVMRPEADIKVLIDHMNQGTTRPMAWQLCEDPRQGSAYLLAAVNGHLVISFRGTNFYSVNKDWVANLDSKLSQVDTANDQYARKYKLPGGHRGFRRRSSELIDNRFFERVDSFVAAQNLNIKDSAVFLTGHSLGAALAQFMVRPMQVHFGPRMMVGPLYLYAPPLAIECQDACQLQRQFGAQTHNISYEQDIVVSVRGSEQVVHFGHFYRCVNDTLRQTLEVRERMTLKRFITHNRHFIRDHRMKTYLPALAKPWNKSPLVVQPFAHPHAEGHGDAGPVCGCIGERF